MCSTSRHAQCLLIELTAASDPALFWSRRWGSSLAWATRKVTGSRSSRAVAEPYGELEQELATEPVLNVNETGWRLNGEKRWIWVFVARASTFYVVAAIQATEVLESLLGTARHNSCAGPTSPLYAELNF